MLEQFTRSELRFLAVISGVMLSSGAALAASVLV